MGPSVLADSTRRVRRAAVLKGVMVNDVHSQLNRTRVARCLGVESVEMLRQEVRRARAEGRGISLSAGRHAMGGQQFGTETLLVDMGGMDRVVAFDPDMGEIEVEAGIQWPALMMALLDLQQGQSRPWSIIQKQTGADQMSLGGALAANVHGRGLRLRPIISNVEAFTLMDAKGKLLRCSRREHPELFRLAIGGYGLFGIITSVQLRLAPRRKLERVVKVLEVDALMEAFERAISGGALYGDFQFVIDRRSPGFLRQGIFSCYRPVDDATPVPSSQRGLSTAQWQELLYLAHVNPSKAFEEYAAYYRSTSGQFYWSDLHQMSPYVPRYHDEVDRRTQTPVKGTEMITELYVPRRALARFLADVARDFRAHQVPLIYGTIRLIERDTESFLAWAKAPYACVIFNLHTVHSPEGVARSAKSFRRLIDLAIRYGGSYYLTYHRFATRAQVEHCYSQFREFLRRKRHYDPDGLFQSDWYRYYARLFGQGR